MNQSLRDQILNGYQGVPECKMTIYNPALTFEGVIAQIRNELFTEEHKPSTPNHFLSVSSTQSSSVDQNYTKRKYKSARGDEKYSSRNFKQGLIDRRSVIFEVKSGAGLRIILQMKEK